VRLSLLSALGVVFLLGMLAPVRAAATAPVASGHVGSHSTGLEIMRENMRRHEFFPYVYEEQTLIMMDAQQQRDVRRIRRYSRLDDDGVFHSLIEFAYPESIAGTALLFTRSSNEQNNSRIFLPALGAVMIDYVGGGSGGQMLGSEFSVDDLVPEETADFIYRREMDLVDDEIPYFVVLAELRPERVAQASYAARRLFVRQDSFFISRIDYLDDKGRLLRRQTRHDLRLVGGEMWRADMISVENLRNGHRSILKVDRRVYSRDYVPPVMFSEQRILAAAHLPDAAAAADGSARETDPARKTGADVQAEEETP